MKGHGVFGKAALISSAVLLLAGLALAAVSFTSPVSTMTESEKAQYSTTVECQAVVKPCTLYPQGGTVPAGKSVINKITRTLLFDITAQVRADQQVAVQGALRTALMLSADGYWEKQYLDAQEQSFTTAQDGGWTAHTTLQLDISGLESFIQRMEEETGINGSVYLIKIVPEVTGNIALGGNDFPLPGVEPVVLEMVDGQMSLQARSDTANGAAAFPIQGSNEIATAAVAQPVFLLLPGFMLPVAIARWISLVLIALPLGPLAWDPAQKLLRRMRNRSEEEQIDRRNRSRIIAIRGGDALQNKPTVELQSFQKLAAMAEHKELPLFKLSGEGSPAYLVIDTGMIYRYTAGATAPQGPRKLGEGGRTIESSAD